MVNVMFFLAVCVSTMSKTEYGPDSASMLKLTPSMRMWLQSSVIALRRVGNANRVGRRAVGDCGRMAEIVPGAESGLPSERYA